MKPTYQKGILHGDMRGLSLLELLITVSIMSVVGVIVMSGFEIISKSKIQLQAQWSSDQESTIWLQLMRKNLNISLLNETAPANSPKMIKYDLSDGSSRQVKYVFYLEDASEERREILSLLNRCVVPPAKVKTYLPHLKESYLSTVLNKLGTHQACVSHLTSLNCEAGRSVVSELRILAQNGKIHYYPAIYSTTAPRLQTFESQVAGMVCVYQTPQNYLMVQMISGTLNQYYSGTDSMRWSLRTLLIPPLNNGNNQYLNQ